MIAPPDTRWLLQTKRGSVDSPPGERGDCVPACIASVLGLPVDAIANTHGSDWFDRLQAEVAKHGYCVAILDLRLEPPPTYWLAAVPSLNLPPDAHGKPQYHCVVAHGYELVHDPSIGENRYDDERWAEVWASEAIASGWVLVPLDPAARR